MQPSGVTFSEVMMSTQTQEKGWALLHMLLVASFSQAVEVRCRHRGDPENPLLSKDGNIMLGGVFNFHSKWNDRMENYTHKPKPLHCTRYFFFSTNVNIM